MLNNLLIFFRIKFLNFRFILLFLSFKLICLGFLIFVELILTNKKLLLLLLFNDILLLLLIILLKLLIIRCIKLRLIIIIL